MSRVKYLQSNQTCSISRDIASRILCLPIYPALTNEEQMEIIKMFKGAQ
jgi:dTDP-4-amino-4,6-dideoxygalactose transaminase